jgi:hypothetical protein
MKNKIFDLQFFANTAAGTVWNLPNYAGDLFTADAINTPILTAIGGMTGGQQTDNFEFVVDSEYSHESATQPAISETASLTAPTAISVVRGQNTNVTQIFQEQVSISYAKMSNQGRLSGLNTAGAQNNAVSEKDFQIARALEKIARDMEYTIINGVYSKATTSATVNKTRGLLAAIESNVVTNSTAAALTKAMMQAMFKEMFDNGATFSNIVLWVNSFQKQAITSLYSYAPQDRNVGGTNIKQIETDFGNIAIALNRFMPQDVVLASEMNVLDAVFQPVPGKGNFFYEELSKTGAAESGQIFGQFGLNHGPEWMHGKITGLTTA